jgi:hypothetical protein
MKYLMVVAFVSLSFVSLSLGFAQNLAELAPADAALSLGWTFQGSVYDTIDDDVKALDWSKGKVALEKLLNFLAVNNDDANLKMMLEGYQAMLSGNYDVANEAFYEFCPAYKDVAAEGQASMEENGLAHFDALMTMSINATNPMPAVTGLMRIDEAAAPLYDKMQSTLLACAKEAGDPAITELEQDGVKLYVIGDGGDFPIVAGSMGNLYFFGSNPDVVRGIVRKVNGAKEDSLADTALYQMAMGKMSLSQNSVSLNVDFAALANALGFAAGMVEDDPTAEYALKRLDSMLRTLGGLASHISVTPEGTMSESVFATNPEGGDTELLKMLNCTTCKVSSPFLAPENATTVSSTYLPIRELFAYADDWVRGVSEAAGEPTNLKDLLLEMGGVDIDTLLLDWIGSEAHTFVLEPISTDAKQLIFGQPQVTVMPVSSPEAAQTGLDQIGEDLWQILPMLMQSGFSAADMAGLETALDSFAVRPYDYKGTTINRVQYSFNGDLGYAFVGNYLVLGTPAKAIESMIDTYAGGRTILDSSRYQEARSRAPEQVSMFSYSQNKPNLIGLADVLELASQPIAFAVSAGFQSILGGDSSSAFEPYSVDLTGVSSEPLEGSGEINLEITPTQDQGYLTKYYQLTGLTPGAKTSIGVSSSDANFYPYSSLINADTSMYIASSEYQDDGTYQISFTPEEGVTYWLEVSGSVPGGFSPYEATLEGSTAEPLTIPSTVELSVATADADSDGYVTKYYQLAGLSAGDTININVTGDVFFPSLSLVDVDTSQYVASSSYQEDGSYQLSFTVEEGKTYWLEVYGSLYDESATFKLESTTGNDPIAQGPLPLTVTISSSDQPEVAVTVAETPSFTELLDAADLLPQLVRVIAEHANTSEGYSQIDGSQIYSKTVSNFKW